MIVGILAALALLMILVAIHELGHFLAARLVRVPVLTFSIGFGPKLLQWKRGETTYCLSLIPLGGYVQLLGEDPTEPLTPADKEKSFSLQPIWKRFLIAVAGPLFNLLLPLFLLFGVYAGSYQALKPQLGSVMSEGSAHQAGLRSGDIILSINQTPVQSFEDVVEWVSDHPNHPLLFTIKRQGIKSPLHITVTPKAMQAQNPLKPNHTLGRIGVLPVILKASIWVPAGSSAALSGLETGDIITHINESPVNDFYQLQTLWNESQTFPRIVGIKRGEKPFNILWNPGQAPDSKLLFLGNLISHVKPNSPAQKAGLLPGDYLVSINDKPIHVPADVESSLIIGAQTQQVLIQRQHTLKQLNLPFSPSKGLGFELNQTAYEPVPTVYLYRNPLQATQQAFQKTRELVELTVLSLQKLIQREVPLTEVGGPIMILDVASKAIEQGFSYYLFIMCLISVNLGLLNLLPIPVLDGGHILFLGIEAIIRKPISIQIKQITTQIGLLFLLCLMALALFNDFMRLWS